MEDEGLPFDSGCRAWVREFGAVQAPVDLPGSAAAVLFGL